MATGPAPMPDSDVLLNGCSIDERGYCHVHGKHHVVTGFRLVRETAWDPIHGWRTTYSEPSGQVLRVSRRGGTVSDGLTVVDARPTQRTASLSSGGVYRYSLGRYWGDGPTATWIMLNPSTADASVDDQTIRRCVAFTKGWGLDGLNVVNLYALRSTDPKALLKHPDPVGPDNEDHILYFLRSAVFAVAAWGAGCVGLPYIDVQVMAKRVGCPLVCLGTTKAGHPRHPLYVKGDTDLVSWPS